MEWQERAYAALSKYNIASPEVEFIRHNENLTCKVTDGQGQQYVLRIHHPIPGFASATAQHTYRALQAELAFIQAIGSNTDIKVQQVVPNSMGDTVTDLGHHCATVLTWVPGKPMHHEDPIGRTRPMQLEL